MLTDTDEQESTASGDRDYDSLHALPQDDRARAVGMSDVSPTAPTQDSSRADECFDPDMSDDEIVPPSVMSETFEMFETNISNSAPDDGLESVPGPSNGAELAAGSAEEGVCVQGSDKALKRNACPFCGKLQTKCARHLMQKHKNEMEVQRAMALPPGKEKRAFFENLIHRGNFKYNSDVIRSGKGTIIPARRPPKADVVTRRDMLPCDKCMGFFSRRNLYRHRCNLSETGRVQALGRALLPSEHDATAGLETILSRMLDGEVGDVCRRDALILDFGRRLASRLGHLVHLHQHVREKMRELGRLLLEIRKTDSKAMLREYIHPSKFGEIASAARALGGLKDGQFCNPSIALKVGHSLVQCASIIKSTGLIQGDSAVQKAATDFLELHKTEWKVQVSSRALGTLEERRWNKTENLPSTDDVQRVQAVLEDELEKGKAALRDVPSISNYTRLAKAALTSLMLFNRRRPGETSRLTLEIYASKSCDVNDDVVKHLPPLEQNLCRSLTHVTVRGKRGRGVPLLLTQEMVEVLDLLVSSREAAGIDGLNPYIFIGEPGPNAAPLRGSDCVRYFARQAEAENITATGYRKHVATMLQLLQLSETEMDVVARFMGHDIRVHRDVYRLPERTVYAAKISKILHVMNQGVGENAGKTVDELQVEVPTGAHHPESDDAGTEPESSGELVGQQESSMDVSEGRRRSTRKNPRSTKRIRWTEQEKAAVRRQMNRYVTECRCPGMAECQAAIREEPALASRTWKDVKYSTYNMIIKHKRDMGM